MSDPLKVIIYYKLDQEKPGHMIHVEFAFRSYSIADLKKIGDRIPEGYKQDFIGDSYSACSFLCSFFGESVIVVSNTPFTTVLECENFITTVLAGYKYTIYSENQTYDLNKEKLDAISNIKLDIGYPQIKGLTFYAEDIANENQDLRLIMDATTNRENAINFLSRAYEININHINMTMNFCSYVNKADPENKEAFIRYSKVLKYWLKNCGYTLYKSGISEYFENNKHNYEEIIYYKDIGDIYAKDDSGKYILDPKIINKILIIAVPVDTKKKEVQIIRSSPTF